MSQENVELTQDRESGRSGSRCPRSSRGIQSRPDVTTVRVFLEEPPVLLSRAEVLARPSQVPAKPGVYAWYFSKAPPGVPVDGCINTDGRTLLYVGISPKRPPASGATPSKQDLRERLRYHFR